MSSMERQQETTQEDLDERKQLEPTFCSLLLVWFTIALKNWFISGAIF